LSRPDQAASAQRVARTVAWAGEHAHRIGPPADAGAIATSVAGLAVALVPHPEGWQSG
jgi:hypothetical protein